MNNRFKFRYWHTKENKYINTQCDCLAICNSCLQSIRGIPDVRGWYNTVLDQAYNDFELIPEQCTGLKDKNGNLIYEGDIIFDGYCKRIVKWGGWCWHAESKSAICPLDEFTLMESEIISNIHEQAEQKD